MFEFDHTCSSLSDVFHMKLVLIPVISQLYTSLFCLCYRSVCCASRVFVFCALQTKHPEEALYWGLSTHVTTRNIITIISISSTGLIGPVSPTPTPRSITRKPYLFNMNWSALNLCTNRSYLRSVVRESST